MREWKAIATKTGEEEEDAATKSKQSVDYDNDDDCVGGDGVGNESVARITCIIASFFVSIRRNRKEPKTTRKRNKK